MPKSTFFFQKTWFLSISGPYFRFLWPIFKTFCHKAREALKNLKKQLTSGGNRTTSGWKSKEIGQIFQTFCQKLVKFLGLGTFLMLKKVYLNRYLFYLKTALWSASLTPNPFSSTVLTDFLDFGSIWSQFEPLLKPLFHIFDNLT